MHACKAGFHSTSGRDEWTRVVGPPNGAAWIANWPELLSGFARQLNPLHEEIFQRFPTENYWTCYQCECATDVVFRRAEFLKRLMKVLVPHAMLSFSSTDVLRYFGKRVTKAGEIPQRFNGRTADQSQAVPGRRARQVPAARQCPQVLRQGLYRVGKCAAGSRNHPQ
jgi:hypothetical protein